MKRIKFIFLLLIVLPLCSCSKGVFDHLLIEYSDTKVDIDGLDNYLSDNINYPSYAELKNNQPNLLNNVKKINDEYEYDGKIYDKEMSLEFYRFSSYGNGFLNNETFLRYDNGKVEYYQLGTAFGGYGVTDIIVNRGDRGHWIFFIYSYGSGIHRTGLYVFDMIDHKICIIKDLKLEENIDYAFEYDSKKNQIDLYEATITSSYDENGFVTYEITKTNLYKEAIDELKKVTVE